MGLAVALLFSLLGQQLQLRPFPGEVGRPVTLVASRLDAASQQRQPLAGLSVQVELPDGSAVELGPTDADGRLQFEPPVAGSYVYAADVAGVRVLAPHRVVARRPRWALGLVSVPLGLVLLWRIWRR